MEARILFNQHFAAQTEGVDEPEGSREGVGSEEEESVLTRAVQSNITAVGTTPANIAAMEIPSVFSNLLLPLPYPAPSSRPFFPRYPLFPKKNTRSLGISRGGALKYFTSAGRNITET